MSEVELAEAYKRLDTALHALESGLTVGGSAAPDTARLKELEARAAAVEAERDALLVEKTALQERYNDLALAFDELREELGAAVGDKLPELDSLRQNYDELERAYNDLQNEMVQLKASRGEATRRLDATIAKLEALQG